MSRFFLVAAVTIVAVLAIWHPAPASRAVVTSAAPVPASRRATAQQKPSQLVVYVVGAVAHDGLFRVREGSRVNDAIRLAGGLSRDADPAAVNLAARLHDGDEVRVARLGENVRATPRTGRTRTNGRRSRKRVEDASPVDVNHADSAEIATLPGIGPALAARIVAFRNLNGPFGSPDDLGDVAGMTAAKITAVQPYLLFN